MAAFRTLSDVDLCRFVPKIINSEVVNDNWVSVLPTGVGFASWVLCKPNRERINEIHHHSGCPWTDFSGFFPARSVPAVETHLTDVVTRPNSRTTL